MLLTTMVEEWRYVFCYGRMLSASDKTQGGGFQSAENFTGIVCDLFIMLILLEYYANLNKCA